MATQAATGVTIQAATLHGTVQPAEPRDDVRLPVRPDRGLRRADRAGLARGGRRGGAGHGRGGRGLVPATTYHVRLVATNATGTSVTADRTFRTPAQALRVALAANPNPTSFGGPTTLVGTVTGTGAAGRPVQIQQRAFPFAAASPTSATPSSTDAAGGSRWPSSRSP